jgi:hypothetical protein
MKTKICLLIFLMVCMLNSCEEETMNYPIDTDIQVSVATSEEGLYINSETEKVYGCCNFSITYEKSKIEHQFIIEFTGIYMPDICLTALGPAKSSIHLGQLDPGEYVIIFSLNDINTHAILSVGSDTTLTIPVERNVKLK